MKTETPDRPPRPPGSQLAFDLPVTEGLRREDFFPSPANAAALAALDDPAQRRLLLIGPHGAGKTHLVHVWAEARQARLVRMPDLPALLPDLPPDAALAIDDADAAPGRDEAALFHLWNRLAPEGQLLLTAATAPRDWELALRDLLSRLQAMPIARLEPPDDDLLAGVLLKLFTDRQIIADARLIPYLLPRMERSIAAAQTLVAALDARSLATHRPVTRALAAEVLDTALPE